MTDILESYADQNERLRQQVERLKREKKMLFNRVVDATCPNGKAMRSELCNYAYCVTCWREWLRRKMKEV